MTFIDFRDSVQDFQTRIRSNISSKRCNIPTEEPNKKHMPENTGSIIHTQFTVSHTNRELFTEQTTEKFPTLEVHDMETVPIDPATAVNTNTNTNGSKWYKSTLCSNKGR